MNKHYYYYYYKKVKGYSQKYGNKKGVTSGSKWDGVDGEEGGDEDVEQEEELGGKITIINKQSLSLPKN